MRGVEKREDDDPREVEAKVLPAREALSLIAPDPLSDYEVLPDTDAAASGGGEESVASDGRTPPSSA
jgi:hypothetical protein